MTIFYDKYVNGPKQKTTTIQRSRFKIFAIPGIRTRVNLKAIEATHNEQLNQAI